MAWRSEVRAVEDIYPPCSSIQDQRRNVLCRRCVVLLTKFITHFRDGTHRKPLALRHSRLYDRVESSCPICRRVALSFNSSQCNVDLPISHWACFWRRETPAISAEPQSALLQDSIGLYAVVEIEYGHVWDSTRLLCSFNLSSAFDNELGDAGLVDLNQPRSSKDCSPNISLAKHWLNRCLDSHQSCHKIIGDQDWIPDRLICHLGKGSYRLVRREHVRQLYHDVQYLALSHRWGPPIDTTSAYNGRTVLTSANVEEWSKTMPALPKTHSQALDLMVELGFKFMWIDSLCILQDSAEDWLEQSSFMKDVYSNATLVIAALSGTDDEGMLHDRDVLTDVGFKLDLGHMIADRSTMLLQSALKLVWVDTKPWSHRYPLHIRAWVCQERAFARRALSIASDRMSWTCDEVEKCELSDETLVAASQVREYLLHRDSAAPDPDAFLRAWDSAVRQYAECELTVMSDKLVAISGIAKEMARAGEMGKYIAGLWELDLFKQLTWNVKSKEPHDAADEYLAPSWSWASLRIPVELNSASCVDYDINYYFDYDDEYIALGGVLEHSITLATAYEFGQVTAGYLRMRGQLIGVLKVETNALMDAFGETLTFDEDGVGYNIRQLRIMPHSLQAGEDSRPDGFTLRCLVLAETKRKCEPYPTLPVFRRVGYAWKTYSDWQAFPGQYARASEASSSGLGMFARRADAEIEFIVV